jgi:hypothetical protein
VLSFVLLRALAGTGEGCCAAATASGGAWVVFCAQTTIRPRLPIVLTMAAFLRFCLSIGLHSGCGQSVSSKLSCILVCNKCDILQPTGVGSSQNCLVDTRAHAIVKKSGTDLSAISEITETQSDDEARLSVPLIFSQSLRACARHRSRRRARSQNRIQPDNQLSLIELPLRMSDPILHAMRCIIKQNKLMRDAFLL